MLYAFVPSPIRTAYITLFLSTSEPNNPFVPYTKLKRFEYAAED